MLQIQDNPIFLQNYLNDTDLYQSKATLIEKERINFKFENQF